MESQLALRSFAEEVLGEAVANSYRVKHDLKTSKFFKKLQAFKASPSGPTNMEVVIDR